MEKDITLRCTEGAWDRFVESKGDYFYSLSALLYESSRLIESFPDFSQEDFPPSNIHKDKDLIQDLLDEVFYSIEKGGDDFEELVENFFINGLKKIPKVKITEKNSLSVLAKYSYLLANEFIGAPLFEDTRRHIFCISRFENLAYTIMSRAFEAIGYWKAKMEEKKRNLENVSVRTKKRMKNIEIIEKMLEEHSYKIDHEFITKAMKKTDRYERCVKDMIKEALEKKNK